MDCYGPKRLREQGDWTRPATTNRSKILTLTKQMTAAYTTTSAPTFEDTDKYFDGLIKRRFKFYNLDDPYHKMKFKHN